MEFICILTVGEGDQEDTLGKQDQLAIQHLPFEIPLVKDNFSLVSWASHLLRIMPFVSLDPATQSMSS